MVRVKGLEHLTLLGLAPPEFVGVAAGAGFGAVGLRISPASPARSPGRCSPAPPC